MTESYGFENLVIEEERVKESNARIGEQVAVPRQTVRSREPCHSNNAQLRAHLDQHGNDRKLHFFNIYVLHPSCSVSEL